MTDSVITVRRPYALYRMLQRVFLVLVVVWNGLIVAQAFSLGSPTATRLLGGLLVLVLASLIATAWAIRRQLVRARAAGDTSAGSGDASPGSGDTSAGTEDAPAVSEDVIALGRGLVLLVTGATVVLAGIALGGWFLLETALPMTLAILFLLAALLLDVLLRTGRFPLLEYGGFSFAQPDLRRFWMAFLLCAFGLGAQGFSVTTLNRSYAWSGEARARFLPDGARSWGETRAFVFHRRQVSEEVGPTGSHSGSYSEELRIPWIFFGACLVYGILVVAWAPKVPAPPLDSPRRDAGSAESVSPETADPD